MWGPDHVGTTSVSAIPGAGDMGAAAATGGGDKSGGVGAGGVVDPALSLLILRFATMIVQKVCFGVGGVCGFWWSGLKSTRLEWCHSPFVCGFFLYSAIFRKFKTNKAVCCTTCTIVAAASCAQMKNEQGSSVHVTIFIVTAVSRVDGSPDGNGSPRRGLEA